MLLVGCSSFVKDAYKTIDDTGTVYQESVNLYNNKTLIIDLQGHAAVRAAATKVYTDYKGAIDTLERYKLNKTDQNKASVSDALVKLSNSRVELERLIQKYY